jgi:hypothetical protein
MAVVIENRLRRMQVFNLPHESYCHGPCACSELALVVLAENPRTGERAPKQVLRRIPGSLTLLSLERKSGLPNAVLDAPEVAAAIRRGAVRVLEHTSAPTPAGPSTASAPSPARGQEA